MARNAFSLISFHFTSFHFQQTQLQRERSYRIAPIPRIMRPVLLILLLLLLLLLLLACYLLRRIRPNLPIPIILIIKHHLLRAVLQVQDKGGAAIYAVRTFLTSERVEYKVLLLAILRCRTKGLSTTSLWRLRGRLGSRQLLGRIVRRGHHNTWIGLDRCLLAISALARSLSSGLRIYRSLCRWSYCLVLCRGSLVSSVICLISISVASGVAVSTLVRASRLRSLVGLRILDLNTQI